MAPTPGSTKQRISDAATRLFLAHGFDHVTVNDVAAAAGVSKPTVFAHFSQKEDLLIDRAAEAELLLLDAVRSRAHDTSPAVAVRQLADRLARQRHPLSGLAPDARPLLEIIAGSPSLLKRARELGYEIETALAVELRGEGDADSAARLPADVHAALIVAAYRTVLTDTAAHVIAGDSETAVRRRHRRMLARAFDALAVAEAAPLGSRER